MLVVFGCRAQHCRPAHIDLLDRLLARYAQPRDRFGERVQIHHHQIDQADMVFLQRRQMFWPITARQNAAVYAGV
jgi:hypothetical protein